MATLTADHSTLSTAYNDVQTQCKVHETKLQESYSTAERFESELADQMQQLDGLRGQLRDTERDSREAQKNFREQVRLSFETRTISPYISSRQG